MGTSATIPSGTFGVSWPWADGFPEFVTSLDLIDSAIKDILFTSTGERKMNNPFGSQLMQIIFENKGPLLDALARREINLAISQNLPAVRVVDITITTPDTDEDPIEITIDYEYLGSQGTVTEQVTAP